MRPESQGLEEGSEDPKASLYFAIGRNSLRLSARVRYKRRVRSRSNFEILQRDFFVGTDDAVVVLVIAASALIRRERVPCRLRQRRRCIGSENDSGPPEVVASVVSRSAVCANSLDVLTRVSHLLSEAAACTFDRRRSASGGRDASFVAVVAIVARGSINFVIVRS